ncbi:hypothetical protein ACSS6W_006216 [Trichoderma asperelloides]
MCWYHHPIDSSQQESWASSLPNKSFTAGLASRRLQPRRTPKFCSMRHTK